MRRAVRQTGDGTQKNKSVASIAQDNAFVFLLDHRSVLKGWQLSHVHVLTAGFLYPEDILRGILSGQHPN
jgi:hypothetical protein